MIDTDLFRWPDHVLPPWPLNDQYVVTPPDPLARTDFEEGDSRQINAYSNAPASFAVVWPMSPRQKRIFDGILQNQLAQGAAWFALPVFTHEEYQLLKVRIVKGTLKTPRQGGEWMVSMTLETDDMQPPTASETAELLITFGSNESLEEICDLLHQIVHYDLPAAMP